MDIKYEKLRLDLMSALSKVEKLKKALNDVVQKQQKLKLISNIQIEIKNVDKLEHQLANYLLWVRFCCK